MADYRIVYGDDDEVVRETYENIDVYKEDGWTVLMRDGQVVLRARDEHVHELEKLGDNT